MEERLTKLPDAICEATIPETFPVSTIASADCCLLKVVLNDSRYKKALRPGPRAVLGCIAHDLAEKAIWWSRSGRGETSVELERILERLLLRARRQLEEDPCTAPYADLPRTMSPLMWARKRRALLDMAQESADRARWYKGEQGAKGQEMFRLEKLRRDGLWVEVPIKVPELRLRGRMDVLERNGEVNKITDIKSGRVEDENGEIAETILRQIRLYGLMAKYVDPSMNIALAINDGIERPVQFDAEIREEMLAWLRSRTDALPSGTNLSSENLAKVGPDCRWCDLRHRCPSYLRDAPVLWGRDLNWRLPLDVWGTAERLDVKEDGLVDLTLRDSGGRRVKVFRLRDFHVAHVGTGDHIWLFDLLAFATELRGSIWRQPLNFYELGEVDNDRAWSLQVFPTTSN